MYCAIVSSLILPITAKINNKERIISVEYFKERHAHLRICSQRLILHHLKSYILRQRKCWEISQMNFTPESIPGWKAGHIIHRWPHVLVWASFSNTDPRCAAEISMIAVYPEAHTVPSVAKATGCIMVFLAKYEFRLGCLIESQIQYIQNLAAILSPQSVPLKVVLFLISATFIVLVVQTRKLGVIHDSFISVNVIHQKIFLGSASKYI